MLIIILCTNSQMFMLPNLSKILYTFQPNIVNKFNIISVNFSDRCCNSMCSCLYIFRSLTMSLEGINTTIILLILKFYLQNYVILKTQFLALALVFLGLIGNMVINHYKEQYSLVEYILVTGCLCLLSSLERWRIVTGLSSYHCILLRIQLELIYINF